MRMYPAVAFLFLAAPGWAEPLPTLVPTLDETHIQGSPVVAPIPLTQDQLNTNNLNTQLASNLAALEPAAGPRVQTPSQALKTLQDYLTGYTAQTPTVFPLAVDDMEGPAGDVQYR
jgi:hypothetical protein